MPVYATSASRPSSQGRDGSCSDCPEEHGSGPRSYASAMVGVADESIRRRVFEWLTRQREQSGEAIPRNLLVNFTLDGVRVPLLGPQGIFKPAVCELPISIATVAGGPYDDAFD